MKATPLVQGPLWMGPRHVQLTYMGVNFARGPSILETNGYNHAIELDTYVYLHIMPCATENRTSRRLIIIIITTII
jgi:hypothetical protein